MLICWCINPSKYKINPWYLSIRRQKVAWPEKLRLWCQLTRVKRRMDRFGTMTPLLYITENVRVRCDITVPVSDVSIPGWSWPSEKIRIWPDLQFFITISVTLTLLQFDNLLYFGTFISNGWSRHTQLLPITLGVQPSVVFYIKPCVVTDTFAIQPLQGPGHYPALCHIMSPPGVCHKLGSDKTNWLNNAHWQDPASDWVILPLVATQLQTLASTIYEYLVPLSSIWIFFQTVHGL